MKSLGTIFWIFFLPVFTAHAVEWPVSVSDLCRSHAALIETFLGTLNLDNPELEAVRAGMTANNLPEACQALLQYYAGRFPSTLPVASPEDSSPASPEADAIREDRFTFYGVEDVVPRTDGGGLDWNWRGPTDDREWAWALNRHSCLSTLLTAWRATGNAAYVVTIDKLIRDWVISNPYTGQKEGGAAWRGLEVALRINNWRAVFTALQDVPEFSPAARLLLLASLPDHAHYLRNYHAESNNWLTMEMNGLALIATTWPELRDSGAWLEYAIEQLVPSMEQQVHSDGAQSELTSHYHRTALRNFQEFSDIVTLAGRSVPDTFQQGLERMWNYLAYTMRPNGHGLLNNDSDYDYTRDQVLEAAIRYKRPDWTYIASNGASGTIPQRPPSVAFPCSGRLVYRESYSKNADWMTFDIGPLGTGHVHYDKLHLSVTIGGRDILVDSGRYTYVGGPWRNYFTGSESHTVILVDGRGQRGQPARYDHPLNGLVISSRDDGGAPTSFFPESLGNPEEARKAPDFIIAPEYVYARGSFEHGYRGVEGAVVHTRIVLRHQSVAGFLVIDHIETDQPRDVTALWQFHPDCAVIVEQGAIKTNDDGVPNLSILPLGDTAWDISLVKGQECPSIQGWYSPRYNDLVPAFTAVCTAHIPGSATFAWHLLPGKEPPKEHCSLSLDKTGWASITIADDTVPLIRIPVLSNAFPEILG